MGQDLSVVVTDRGLNHADLFGVVHAFLPASQHPTVVLAYGATPGTFPALAVTIPAFTVFSVWADGDTSGCLRRLTESLSALLHSACAVLTAADHSCVGGWELFREGVLIRDQWCLGDGYLDVPLQGVAALAGVSRPLPSLEAELGLVSLLAEPTSVVCLRSGTSALHAGSLLTSHQMLALLESDLPGLTLECLLGGAP